MLTKLCGSVAQMRLVEGRKVNTLEMIRDGDALWGENMDNIRREEVRSRIRKGMELANEWTTVGWVWHV